MEENLVGYLLSALDPDTQRLVESELRANPKTRQRLEALRQALEPLEADRGDEPAPAGLALRTLGRVAEHRCEELPRAPQTIRFPTTTPPRRWWRRADVLVAAVLLLALSGLFWPMVSTLRNRSQRLECENNLRAFHHAISNYSEVHHGALPKVEDQERRNVAGVFVPILHDGGFLGKDVSIRCPGNGEQQAARWSLKELDEMTEEEFNRCAVKLAGCYAYSLGYRDEAGRLHGLKRSGNDRAPLLADRPFVAQNDPDNPSRQNSPNHGGDGQNVLFVGGNVQFLRDHTINSDDIFTNRRNQVRAGLDEWDSVLGASDDRP